MGDKQCWTGIGFLTYPSGMGIWLLKKIVYNDNTGIGAKMWKFIPSGINMYKLQFSHNGMSIMVLKCVISEGYIISIWIC